MDHPDSRRAALKDQIGAAPDIANTEVKVRTEIARLRPELLGIQRGRRSPALSTMSAKTASLVSIERPQDWLKRGPTETAQFAKMRGARGNSPGNLDFLGFPVAHGAF